MESEQGKERVMWEEVEKAWAAQKVIEKFLIRLSVVEYVTSASIEDQAVINKILNAVIQANTMLHHLLYDTKLGQHLKQIKE